MIQTNVNCCVKVITMEIISIRCVRETAALRGTEFAPLVLSCWRQLVTGFQYYHFINDTIIERCSPISFNNQYRFMNFILLSTEVSFVSFHKVASNINFLPLITRWCCGMTDMANRHIFLVWLYSPSPLLWTSSTLLCWSTSSFNKIFYISSNQLAHRSTNDS